MRVNLPKKPTRRGILASFFVAVISVLLSHCGGGTVGTGGTGSQINGRLLDTSSAPVSSALLTVEETGESATTDESGTFSITTEISNNAVTLLIESGPTTARTVVNEIPAGDQLVDLELQLDAKAKKVEVTRKRVSPRPKPTRPSIPTKIPELPTPAPTATAAPQETPTPAPTSAETSTPTPPGVVPTSTATPLPTTPILRTHFLGTVAASDPALLLDATIAIPGKGQRPVAPNGTFSFSVRAGGTNSVIALHSGGKIARAQIEGVTELSKKVTVNLSLSTRPNGNLKLTVLSIEIIERSPGNDAADEGSLPSLSEPDLN